MRERRRTVTIATRLYPPEVTAASFRMQGIVESLSVDHAVKVLTTRPPVSGKYVEAKHAHVVVSRAPVLRDRSGAIRGYLQYLSFDFPLFFRLLVTPADVIVAEAPPTTGLVALVVARLRRQQFIYYPGDVWTDGVIAMGASQPVVTLMRWMESRVLRGAQRVLSVSPEVTERLMVLGAGRDKIVDVGNGVDTRVFNPDIVPQASNRPYFVYAGTMSEWQEPGIFIRALARLDADVDLHFFGQGSSESELRALAEELAPGRVHFGGVVTPEESAAWIRGAAAALVSIVPGIGYDFARPTKTYAAAACGSPVLFTGASTGGDVVRSGALGEAVPFLTDAVAEAMGRLLKAAETGETERLREARSQWIDMHYSLAAAGDRAAAAVRNA